MLYQGGRRIAEYFKTSFTYLSKYKKTEILLLNWSIYMNHNGGKHLQIAAKKNNYQVQSQPNITLLEHKG
jgi:hypothetical protein